MSLHVQCSQCAATYNLADSLAGKKFRCKKCQAVVAVPVPAPKEVDEDEVLVAPKPAVKPRTPAPAVRQEEDEPRPERAARPAADKTKKPSNSRLARNIRSLFTAAILFALIGLLLIVVALVTTPRGAQADKNLAIILLISAAASAGVGGLLACLIPLLLLVWLARSWNSVAEEEGGMSGAKAVALLFVPVFNIYWMFRVIPGISTVLSKALEKHDRDANSSAGHGAGMAACLMNFIPGLNALAVLPLLMWLNAADKAMNRLMAARAAAELDPQRRPRSAQPAPLPQRSGLKTVLLAGLGMTVLGGCCAGVGLSAWFFVLAPLLRPENQIVGVWQLDVEATKTVNGDKWHLVPANLAIEFNQDGTCRFTERNYEGVTGTWKVAGKKDPGLVLTIQPQGWAAGFSMRLTPKDQDHLVLDECLILDKCVLKRVSTFPAPPKYVDDNVAIVQPRAQLNLGLGKAGASEAKVDRLVIFADGSRVAVSNYGPLNHQIQIWDITAEPKKLHQYEGRVVELSPDGKRLLRSGVNFGSQIVEVEGGKKVSVLDHFGRYAFQAPDVVWVIPTSFDPTKQRKLVMHKYDASTGKKQESFDALDDDRVELVAPVKEGKEIYFGSKPNRIQVWDTQAQKVVRNFTLAIDKMYRIDWFGCTVSADGKRIAARVTNGMSTGTIFDGETGAKVATLAPGMTPYQSAFLANRDIFLTTSNIAHKDKSGNELDIVAYDFTKQSVVAVFRGHEKGGLQVAVAADGKTLVAGNEEGNVLIWDLTQLK